MALLPVSAMYTLPAASMARPGRLVQKRRGRRSAVPRVAARSAAGHRGGVPIRPDADDPVAVRIEDVSGRIHRQSQRRRRGRARNRSAQALGEHPYARVRHIQRAIRADGDGTRRIERKYGRGDLAVVSTMRTRWFRVSAIYSCRRGQGHAARPVQGGAGHASVAEEGGISVADGGVIVPSAATRRIRLLPNPRCRCRPVSMATPWGIQLGADGVAAIARKPGSANPATVVMFRREKSAHAMIRRSAK